MFEGLVRFFLLRVDTGDRIFDVGGRSARTECFLIDLESAIELSELLQRCAETKPETLDFRMRLRQLFIEGRGFGPIFSFIRGACLSGKCAVGIRLLSACDSTRERE